MKVEYKNRCSLCYFGKPMGELMGKPMCEECMSHRIVVTDEMRERKPGITPGCIGIPAMKTQEEWEWWQDQTREALFDALDAVNERLNHEIKENCDLRTRVEAYIHAFALQRLSLLRLRIGFANMCELFFKNQVPSIRDEKFWFKVRHKMIYLYDKYKQSVERYNTSILRQTR